MHAIGGGRESDVRCRFEAEGQMPEPEHGGTLEMLRWRMRRGARRFRKRHDIAFIAGFTGLVLVVLLAMWLY
jgi:hypothetical protein